MGDLVRSLSLVVETQFLLLGEGHDLLAMSTFLNNKKRNETLHKG